MKYLFLLILLVSFVIPTFAQEEITLDTIIEVRSGDTVRTMTVQEALDELDSYLTKRNAYRGEDGIIVVPMSPEYAIIAKEQKELGFYSEVIENRGKDISASYNKTYGDQGTFAVYFDAALNISGDSFTRKLDGHAYAGAYIFNIDARIASFDVNAANEEYGLKGSASLKVLGQDIWSKEVNLQLEWKKEYSQELIKVTVPYFGFLSASVTVYVTGEIGFNCGIKLASGSQLGIQGIIEPYIQLGTKIDASPLDAIVASINVECDLNLMRWKLPISATAFYMKGVGLRLSIESDLILEALDGSVYFVFKIFGWDLIREPIFEWDSPINENIGLWDYYKSFKE